MKTKKSLLLLTILSISKVFAQEAKSNENIEIPFRMDRNLIIVKAKINQSSEYDFIFDTGTTGVVLSDSIAKNNNIKPKGFETMLSPNGNNKEKVPYALVNKIILGKFQSNNQRVVLVPNESIFSPTAVGIIGISYFKGKTFTIDYKNSKLIIKKENLASKKANVISIKTFPALEGTIEVNSEKVIANFDCGSPVYIAIPKEWESKYKFKKEPILIGKGRTPSGEFEVYESVLDGEIIIGTLKLKNPKITLVTGGFKTINFGYEFFSVYKVTIDSRNKLISIE